ncbi:MAG: phage tail sheath subtilisin-like domain-containing protein [Oscillospiraceae bacterium]
MNTVHERPGVYSSYDASAVIGGGSAKKGIGMVVKGDTAVPGEPVTVTSYAEGYGIFGKNAIAALLLEALFLGGAGTVIVAKTAATGTVEDYKAAFAVLEKEETIRLMLCDSGKLAVHQALRTSVLEASQNRRERIAVVGGESDVVTEMVSHAADLNCERVILVGPNVTGTAGAPTGALYAAAAVAAAIAGNGDPVIPLNGVPLRGVEGLSKRYSDDELDLLIRGGVTPLEYVAGICSPVRCVTTRTKTGAVADSTWRETGTILVVDDVIPTIRTTLRSKFARSKNTAQSRGAIRAQVIVELQNKLRAEIIDGYGEVKVSAQATDPTICLVEFDFTVAHGLNQIHLTAHITV